MNTRLKRCLISVVAAVTLTGGLIYAAQQPSSGPNIISYCILPFYMIGVFFSHNIHQPSTIGSFGSLFLFFFVVAYAIQAIWALATNHDR